MLYFLTLHPKLFSRIHVSIWWFSFLGVCFLREFGFIKKIININTYRDSILGRNFTNFILFLMQVSLLVSRLI
jgi:hypothetical protein